MNIYYVYVLQSDRNGRYYTGSSKDFNKRLAEHNSGKSKATRFSRPYRLVHLEQFSSRSEATKREKELKSGRGREELAHLVAQNFAPSHRGVAQLVARLVRDQEVPGSNPGAPMRRDVKSELLS